MKIWLSEQSQRLLQWARQHRRYAVLAMPYVWLGLFFAVPFLIVLKISFAKSAFAIPPFTDLVSYVEGILTLTLNLENYGYIFQDPHFAVAFYNSIRIAAVSTFLTLLIGFPIALAISRLPEHQRNIFLLLIILPSWTSFLLRVYAWIGILKQNGLINQTLMGMGLIDQPLQLLYTEGAMYVGIVYTYLPFMVLPLYAVLVKLNHSLIEASADLGARKLTTLFTVIIPLAKGGIISGCMLVFIPVVGEYVIPELLGGGNVSMIGRELWNEFFGTRDWPLASAVAIVMIGVLLIPIMYFNRLQSDSMEKGT